MDEPVSLWIEDLRNADEAAARKLWNRYVVQLQESARRKLRPNSRNLYDEEDAALSAFNSFCVGIAAGRFPDLKDRESLVRLLLVITNRKVSRRHRHDRQQRRDVRRTSTDPHLTQPTDDTPGGVHYLESREPSPEFGATFSETCDKFIDRLGDPKLIEVALLRIEGYTDGEIAERLKCVRSTVQRRLSIIRRECEALAETT